MKAATGRWADNEPERLRVYCLALRLADQVRGIVRRARCSGSLVDQAARTVESIVLNIAEGSAHQTPGQKSRHYQIARASADECVACLDLIRRSDPRAFTDPARRNAQLVARMLTPLIDSWEKRK